MISSSIDLELVKTTIEGNRQVKTHNPESIKAKRNLLKSFFISENLTSWPVLLTLKKRNELNLIVHNDTSNETIRDT